MEPLGGAEARAGDAGEAADPVAVAAAAGSNGESVKHEAGGDAHGASKKRPREDEEPPSAGSADAPPTSSPPAPGPQPSAPAAATEAAQPAKAARAADPAPAPAAAAAAAAAPAAEKAAAAGSEPAKESEGGGKAEATPLPSDPVVDAGEKEKRIVFAFTKLIEVQRKPDGKGGKKFVLGDLVRACCDKDPGAFPVGMISKAQRNAPGIVGELCACRPKMPGADGRQLEDAQELITWMAKQPFFHKSWLNEMVHQIRTDIPKPGSKTNIDDLLKLMWPEAPAEAPAP